MSVCLSLHNTIWIIWRIFMIISMNIIPLEAILLLKLSFTMNVVIMADAWTSEMGATLALLNARPSSFVFCVWYSLKGNLYPAVGLVMVTNEPLEEFCAEVDREHIQNYVWNTIQLQTWRQC